MGQVVRTTNELISNALYLLGELAVNETPDSFMLTTGLDLINELLDKFAADSIYIPYLTDITFNMVQGQGEYSISDLGTADITADRIVDLSFANYIVPGSGNPASASQISMPFTADSATNLFTIASTSPYPVNSPVLISTTGTVPSPFVAGVTYYFIPKSSTTFQLASSSANGLLGIPIIILTDGIGQNILTMTNFPTSLVPASIIYPLQIINKAQFYNVVRLQPLTTRPGFIMLNKQATESFIMIYPQPDQPYACMIRCKVMIDKLVEQENLNELPPFYYGFLKYALARKFLAYYPSGNWPQTNEDEYNDYFSTLKNANETDLTIRPSAVLTRPEPFWWQNILAY